MVQLLNGGVLRNNTRRPLLWARLRRYFAQAELVELCSRRFVYQPQSFRWHGLIHTVWRIEQVWERVGSHRQHPRRYFRVTCQDDRVYTLFQDLTLGAWYIEA